jgi:hypothetical protein
MKTIARIRLVSVVILTLFAFGALAQLPKIQYWRPYNQKGVNMFEVSKNDSVPFEGVKFRIGAGFTQGFQKFNHSTKSRAILTHVNGATTNYYIQTANGNGELTNTFINRNDLAATPTPIPGTFTTNPQVYGAYLWDNAGTVRSLGNGNALYEMAGGFPLAQANLNFDVQIADGVSLSLTSYMSSHHHNEFWVKGGYFKIDKVGFLNSEFMNKLWTNLTLKVGHMEVNYGDSHFRRSDGGNTLQNPFMENNIMDAFTTEIGGELYFQKNGVMAMVGLTDGEIQGNVSKPNDRSPNIYLKLGYDKQFTDDFRARVSGSLMTTKSSVRNTLYGGDRTGSNYQFVVDNTAATVTGAFTSGRFNPGLTDNLTAWVINPFVKFRGFELFGTYERAKGNSAVENDELQNAATGAKLGTKLDDRIATQTAVDLLYRFGKNERYYIGAKYNKVDATIALGQATGASYLYAGDRFDVSIDRTAFAAGWFITPSVLLKAEYVMQNYGGFPEIYTNKSASAAGYLDSHIYTGAKFDGFVVQGVISF